MIKHANHRSEKNYLVSVDVAEYTTIVHCVRGTDENNALSNFESMSYDEQRKCVVDFDERSNEEVSIEEQFDAD